MVVSVDCLSERRVELTLGLAPANVFIKDQHGFAEILLMLDERALDQIPVEQTLVRGFRTLSDLRLIDYRGTDGHFVPA